MDQEVVKKAILDLDAYANDYKKLKDAFDQIIPTIKTILHVDDTHPLQHRISINLGTVGFIDRLIKKEIMLYQQQRST
jgi:hypothetical protein